MLGADEKQCPEAARPNNNAWAVPAHKGEGDTNREDCAELAGKWVRQKKKTRADLLSIHPSRIRSASSLRHRQGRESRPERLTRIFVRQEEGRD